MHAVLLKSVLPLRKWENCVETSQRIDHYMDRNTLLSPPVIYFYYYTIQEAVTEHYSIRRTEAHMSTISTADVPMSLSCLLLICIIEHSD